MIDHYTIPNHFIFDYGIGVGRQDVNQLTVLYTNIVVSWDANPVSFPNHTSVHVCIC